MFLKIIDDRWPSKLTLNSRRTLPDYSSAYKIPKPGLWSGYHLIPKGLEKEVLEEYQKMVAEKKIAER